VTSPFEPPPWTIGRGDRFSVTAGAIAGRSGRFGCPARVSLGARRKAQSLQPVDTRWRRRWDPADGLYFALRDAGEAVDEGASMDEATAAADQRLTHPNGGSSVTRCTSSPT
jgi:hypothetical protein